MRDYASRENLIMSDSEFLERANHLRDCLISLLKMKNMIQREIDKTIKQLELYGEFEDNRNPCDNGVIDARNIWYIGK